MATSVESKHHQQFGDDGYAVFDGFLTPAQVKEALDAIEDVKERIDTLPNKHVYMDVKGDLSTLKQIQQLHLYSTFANKLAEGPCRGVAEELLGAPVTLQNVQFFNKNPKVSLDTPAHQDGFYFMIKPQKAVTMWLALDHADEDNGCVWYVRGSHKLGMRPHAASAYPPYNASMPLNLGLLGFSQKCTDFGQDHDLANQAPMRARPGDMLCHHSLTLHFAGANRTEDRPRRALGFIFYAEDVQVDQEAHARYQAELAANLEKQGRI